MFRKTVKDNIMLFYEVLTKSVLLMLQNTYTGGIHLHLKPLET